MDDIASQAKNDPECAVNCDARLCKDAPSVASLFAGRTPEEWREIYRESLVDWGPDVGREGDW